LLGLEVIGESLDEGDEEGLIDLGLRLDGDEAVVGEAVEAVQLEAPTGVFEVELAPRQETEVVLEDFQIH
jgi:hypothetical protein